MIKIYGLSDSERDKILNIIDPKPTGPMYNSKSKGSIPISSMSAPHRFHAAKKIVIESAEKAIQAVRDAKTNVELVTASTVFALSQEEVKLICELADISFDEVMTVAQKLLGNEADEEVTITSSTIEDAFKTSLEKVKREYNGFF